MQLTLPKRETAARQLLHDFCHEYSARLCNATDSNSGVDAMTEQTLVLW